MDIWIGSSFQRASSRILILGESWYGEQEALAVYIPRWIRDEIVDAMFSRLFNTASGYQAADATALQRSEWWNGIAFYNFVPGSVGPCRDSRPSTQSLKAAQQPLSVVLNEVRPQGVWIIGKEQSKYSVPVVKQFGCCYEVTAHTASFGLSAAALSESWQRLLACLK